MVGSAGIYAKLQLLSKLRDVILPELRLPANYEIPILHRIAFLYPDALVGLILIPLMAVLIFGAIPKTLRLVCAATVASGLFLLIFYQVHAHWIVGQYVSFAYIVESYRFLVSNWATANFYFPFKDLLRAVAVGILLTSILAVGNRLTRLGASGAFGRWLIRVCTPRRLAVFVALPVLIIVGTAFKCRWTYPTDVPEANGSTVKMMWEAVFASELNGEERYPNYSYQQMVEESRSITATKSSQDNGPLQGSMKGANVLIFVVETGPSRYFDLAGDGRNYPGVSELIGHSFVGLSHYSTYPYTCNAVFSIMSGLYPLGRRHLLGELNGRAMPGLLTSLKKSGYATGVFSPALLDLDELMYKSFGAETIYIATRENDIAAGKDGDTYAAEWRKTQTATVDFTGILSRDDKVLNALQRHIRQTAAEGKRFADIILPQSSHGIWQGSGSVPERGRRLMQLQAVALSRVIETLRETGQLDNTIIVLTGDHGVRAHYEDPSLRVGWATSYTFQVPMLIYAPKALQQTMPITTPTSHIDIASTVLALLGNQDAFTVGQGVPIWMASPERRLYLLCRGYGGFDAYEQGGTYFMQRPLVSRNYARSGNMEFDDPDVLNPSDPRSLAIDRAYVEYKALQKGFVETLVKNY